MNLFKHQQDILDLNPPKYLLAHGTGTGKTRTAIALAEKNCKMFLVICPKSLKENWHREILKWSSKQNGQYMVVSKEEFKKRKGDISNIFDGVILDEAHYFANSKSQLYKDFEKFIKLNEIKFIWGLTATPYLSSAWNIFNLAKLLGHTWNYMKFKHEFFYDVQMGRRTVPVQRPGIEKEMAILVNRIGNTVTLDDIAEVPEQTFETEYITLTEDQEKAIKDLTDITFITRFTKQHQIENGALKGDGYIEDTLYSNLKFNRIKEICEENPKVAIFCRYNLQIESLRKFLEDEILNRTVYIINGKVKEKDPVVQAIEADASAIVIINASCSEGYQLPSIGVIVYASLSFSLKDSIQSRGRFLRGDRMKKNLYIYLVSGEVDEAVYATIMNKHDFHMAIFAREKRNVAQYGNIKG